MNAIAWHQQDYAAFSREVGLLQISGPAAAFLVIGALVVITCSCLCFYLPGVNVLTDIVLPGLVPGLSALVCSIPFITFSVIHARKRNRIWKAWTPKIEQHLKDELPKIEKKEERVDYIITHIIKRGWSRPFRDELFKELLKPFKNDKEKKKNPVYMALVGAQKKLGK